MPVPLAKPPKSTKPAKRTARSPRRSPNKGKAASKPASANVVKLKPVTIVTDKQVPFPAFFVNATQMVKTAQRKYVAEHAKKTLQQHLKEGTQGAVVFDIDDTLINGNEAVTAGFEYMVELFKWAQVRFPVEVVTARPNDQKANVMQLLHKRGLTVAFDHLHMMDTKEYDSGKSDFVKDFKWGKHKDFVKQYGRVLARLGDKMWDVAERHSPDTYLRHVGDRQCYCFADPALGGTWSYKLPGV